VRAIDFSDVLLQGMLSVLLFAAALHIDIGRLRRYRWQIGALALVGTVASTLVVGAAAWLVLPWIGVSLPLVYCLLFGALISPTDPIAVMSVLKSAGVPKDLELVIAGESLFNDGIGVVDLRAARGRGHARHAELGRRRAAAPEGGRRRDRVRARARLGHVSPPERRRPVQRRGAAHPRRGHRRLVAREPAARLGPARDGGGRPARRQPGPRPCDVGDDARLHRRVLAAARRDPQRGALRAHRRRGAARRVHRQAAARRRAGDRDHDLRPLARRRAADPRARAWFDCPAARDAC
jgi:hypothetical protein